MKTKGILAVVMAVGLLVLAMMLIASPAEAQKKKAKPKAPVTQQKEPASDSTAEEEAVAPPELPNPPAAVGGLVEVLKKYQTQKTNLGILKKVTGDYIEVDDDGTIITVPMRSIHSLRQVPDRDNEDKAIIRLEIKLYAKD